MLSIFFFPYFIRVADLLNYNIYFVIVFCCVCVVVYSQYRLARSCTECVCVCMCVCDVRGYVYVPVVNGPNDGNTVLLIRNRPNEKLLG